MILDDPEMCSQIDKSDILSHIKSLPEYIQKGWKLGKSINAPGFNQFKHLAIVGNDIFSDAADLLKHFLVREINIPIFFVKDFILPGWLKGRENLIIQISNSGNSETEITFLRESDKINCKLLAITPPGKLADAAIERNIPVITITDMDFSVGLIFPLFLSVFNKLGLIADFRSDIDISTEEVRNLISKIDDNVLTTKNPAKRLAIQMVNRWIVIIGGENMQPVTRHWMNQINLYAKCWAQCAELPDMANNLVEGSIFPENMISHTMNVFINSSFNNQHIQLLTQRTRQMLMVAGIGTDMINARGNNLLSQIFNTMLFGDFVAYYLSLAYQVDPSSRFSSNL